MKKKSDLNMINTFKLLNKIINLKNNEDIKDIKNFINDFYCLDDNFPEDFYELILNQIHNNPTSLFNVLKKRDIYLLISYLKYNQEDVSKLKEAITPLQYYIIPKRYINKIISMLKTLKFEDKDTYLSSLLKDEPAWLLKKIPNFNEFEYIAIAYKIYISIGFDNGLELLLKKYGEVDYNKIYFLFSKLNVKNNREQHENVANFLFDNKKDSNNIIRQILNGEFKELFLNFDYFYNNFNYFVSKLGIKLTKSKVSLLLKERYVSQNPTLPEITGDILEDMISSYYNKYNFLETPEGEIHNKNFELYNKFLRKKYKSSIPMIKFDVKNEFLCEIIKLNDPRNLVLGYRSGNCFRINGDASILFHKFLENDHMRLLSVSTLENKDFAMMLIMRNGNVLIGQGIEVSKWAPSNIKGKKLYDVCKEVLKEMMEYMNSTGDEIVATIIGSSNSNVSQYNKNILPFLINPILENSNNYYNGIYNYQCLLDIKEGKNLKDIKLYTPNVRYLDERKQILRREKMCKIDNKYLEIEKILTSLRFLRMSENHNIDFYQNLSQKREIYTSCNTDWYITLFDDGTIDSYILDNDKRAKIEYYNELKCIKQNAKNKYTLKYK